MRVAKRKRTVRPVNDCNGTSRSSRRVRLMFSTKRVRGKACSALSCRCRASLSSTNRRVFGASVQVSMLVMNRPNVCVHQRPLRIAAAAVWCNAMLGRPIAGRSPSASSRESLLFHPRPASPQDSSQRLPAGKRPRVIALWSPQENPASHVSPSSRLG